MTWKIVLLLLIVPILNITLNTLAQKTSKQEGSFVAILLTPIFLFALFVGVSSLLVLVTLYRQNVALPRGLLLMGAMSILGGSLWGVWYSGQQLTHIEWVLLATIASLLLWRFINM